MLYRERERGCYERDKGERGVTGAEEEGEAVAEVEVLPRPEWVRTMVMLRLIGTSSGTVGWKAVPAEKVLNFRSLPRPVSGAGPANVSSQSLWRKPIIYTISSLFSRILVCASLQHEIKDEGSETTERKKKPETNFFFYNFSFFFCLIFVKNERLLITRNGRLS